MRMDEADDDEPFPVLQVLLDIGTRHHFHWHSRTALKDIFLLQRQELAVRSSLSCTYFAKQPGQGSIPQN